MALSIFGEVALGALHKRWGKYFENRPQLDELTPEQIAKAGEIIALQEERRQEAMKMYRNNVRV